jgi:hypothetical protein
LRATVLLQPCVSGSGPPLVARQGAGEVPGQ